MNKPYCFIIWGISDSGKDTVYKLINKHLPTTDNIKASQPCKDIFEKWLNLPKDSLNDKDFRSKQVVNTITGQSEDYTYDDLLVRAFKAWNDMVPGGWLTVGYVGKVITDKQNPYYLNRNIAFTDVRRHSELDMIKLKLTDKYNLVFIHVLGRGTLKESDKELTKEDFSFIKEQYTLYNSPELDEEELEYRVKTLLDYLSEDYN